MQSKKIEEWIKKNEYHWWETRHLGNGLDLIKAIRTIEHFNRALEFYADKSIWSEEFQGGPRSIISTLEGEGFEVAQEAIAAAEKEIE